MVCGLLAVRGLRGGSMWLWMAVGMVIFIAADVTYVLQVQAASYETGPILSFVWLAGLTIFCLAISRPERSRRIRARHAGVALVAPTLATLIAIASLAVFSIANEPIIMGLA